MEEGRDWVGDGGEGWEGWIRSELIGGIGGRERGVGNYLRDICK